MRYVATIVLCHQKVKFVYSANLLLGKRVLLLALFFLCFIGLSGATSAFVGMVPAGNVAETQTSAPPINSQEQNWPASFDAAHPLGQDWRQYAARDEVKPALQAPERIVLESVKTPPTKGHTTILLLTLRANNIQVRAVWKVTNTLNAFDIDNGKLSLTADPNKTAIFVATVYLIDNFQALNTAYQNLTASAVITVEVKALVESLSVAAPPRLEVTAGIAEEVYVFAASGGKMPHTYALLHNPNDDAFHFTNGTLSVNISATIGEYRFTVAVVDAASMAVTVTATVEVVAAPLAVAQPPRLEVTVGAAEEVYVFVASGGVMPHTYALLHNPDANAFYFTNGTLSVNISATIGEYRFTVAVNDADSMTVTVAATVSVVMAADLSVTAPPRLEVTAGIAEEVYVFVASGGIMPHTYTLLHNPNPNAFYFTNGTLSVNISATIGVYRFTIAVADAASRAVTVAATVSVAMAADLSVTVPPRLEVTAGAAEEVYVFVVSGGIMPHTYTLLHNPNPNAFYFTNGTLSVNISATIGEYHFTVAVADALSRAVTVTATVSVAMVPDLSVAIPPRLEVTAGAAEEVYVFVVSGGIMPHTYTLLHNPNPNAFYFTNGTLSVNISATIGEYRFTVAVNDADSMTVTVTATVSVVMAAPLAVAQPPRLEVTVGAAEEVYVFVASGGIMPHTYTLLHNPNDDAFYFTQGTLSVNVSATIGEYHFTVAVADALSRAVTVTATVFVRPADLLMAAPPRLEVTAGMAKEVYVFAASGGTMPHTYTLLHNPDDDVFYFTQGTLAVNFRATIGVYRFTVAVADAASIAVTVTATVDVAAPLPLVFLAEAPPLAVTSGASVNLYTFTATGGIGDKRYTIVADNPGGFVLAADSGVLSLLPEAAEGVYMLTVEASDRATPPNRITTAATVRVSDRQIFVLGGSAGITLQNDVWSSVDGRNWRLAADDDGWAKQYNHQALSHQGRLYVLGGNDGIRRRNDVWSSADGTNWSRETDDAGWAARGAERDGYQAVSHQGRLYVMGGRGNTRFNDVWSSADGTNWSRETDDAGWAKRERHQALSHNGRLYVLGGVDNSFNYLNDVWSSADGTNWSRETDDAEWAGRINHQALSHNGRLYVLGGNDGSNRRNDVWSSADGKNWRPETAGAEWSGRDALQALSHHGRLYVLGGRYDLSSVLNDVWSSADGKEWALITLSADWSRRYAHQAVVFPSPLVLFGVGERLTIAARAAPNLHTFTAHYGEGDYSYSLYPAVSGFAVNAGGVLAAVSGVTEGNYTLTVWVEDEMGSRAQTALRVFVGHFNLAEVPPLFGLESIPKVLHTFTTDGGIAGEQYKIVAGNTSGYFAIDAASGVLSLPNTSAEGVYTLSVEASDSSSLFLKATAVATVAVNDRWFFVLGGNSGSSLNDVWLSADGANWGRESNDVGWAMRYSHQALSHHGRLYVLGGNDGGSRLNDVWSAADGANWSLETDDAGWTGREGHQSLSHNGRLYVLGGNDGSRLSDVWSSTDGANWGQETADAGWTGREGHQSLSHNGRLYVLGGFDDSRSGNINDVWSSADGANWVLETADAGWPGREEHQALSHNGRLYVLGGFGSSILSDVWSSADGANWSLETNGAGWEGRDGHQALSHQGRLYVLGGDDDSDSGNLSDVWSSADGANWSLETNNANWSGRKGHQAVIFPPQLALFGVAERLTATAAIKGNLHTFKTQFGVGDYSYSLIPAVSGFAVSPGGVLATESNVTLGNYTLTVWVEDDADNRAQTAVKVFVKYLHLAEVPPLFGLAGIAKILHTITTDGGIPGEQYRIVAGDTPGYFAMDADSGVLSLLSTAWEGIYTLSVEVSDGLSLSRKATAVATVEITGRQIFILGGNDDSLLSDVWSSMDGANWGQETADAGWAGREGHQAVSHQGRLYVLGGDDGSSLNDVWSSTDGANWSRETAGAEWPGREGHQALSHQGRLYVLGGVGDSSLNDVWSAADGANWSLETAGAEWEGREGHQAVSHNGRLYVLGGLDDDDNNLNDVWSSADGANWVQETADAGWEGREGHQALSHQGRLYVLGGVGSNRYNDVWSSVDGKSWVQETAGAGWEMRDEHQALLYNGRFYVLGGLDDDGNLNDVWSSADGQEWELITLSADWSERTGHQAVVFPPELALFGVAERLTAVAAIAEDLHTFTAQYGRGGYSYSLTPAVNGFAVNAGVLATDSKVTMGDYTLTVWVEDDAGYRTQTAVKVFVAHLHLVEAPRLWGLEGVADVLHTFTTDGGIAGEQYKMVAGNESGYFALDADSGVLSLLSTAWEGVYTLSVEVSDVLSLSLKATAVVTVEINDRWIFVLGGYDGSSLLNDVWSAADSKNWRLEIAESEWLERNEHQAVSHQGRLYVLGGYADKFNPLNDVWSAANGKNWSLETAGAGWARRYNHQAVSHQGRLYVLGGWDNNSNRKNDVWSSAGGKNWSLETANAEWAGRSLHQALSHNGRLYVLGGTRLSITNSITPQLNDVWSSADGKNWSLETANAGWSPRNSHQALSHNGRLYVLGGQITFGNHLKDVWSSADGKNWSLETAEPGWTARRSHQAVSYQGRLYVLGGIDSGNLNDVWSSADGKNWSRETNGANWSGRSGHRAVVFPPSLALLGVGERLTANAGIAEDLHTFKSQYGRGDYSYSLTPEVPGFAVNADGVLSTKNDVAVGEYILTVWVKDDADNLAQTVLRVIVNNLHLPEVPLLSGFAGVAKVLHTIIAEGVIPGEQYMIVAGNTQGYFAVDAGSGVLSLLSTAWEGVYTLSVEVSDGLSLSRKATAAATVEIKGRQLFVLGGRDGSDHFNDVWFSTDDGANWSLETANAEWGGRAGHQVLSHHGRLYVLGGYDGNNYLKDVWSSADGKNWSLETSNAEWDERSWYQALSHHGRLYVLGGYDGGYLKDVWSSADGANWSLETANAEWDERGWHQALSHNGRLYVLGGTRLSVTNSNITPQLNDVWSSADGANWSLETSNAEWAGRDSHQALSYNGRLYVLGGDDGNRLNDVWWSADGKNWSLETANAEWAGRDSHQALSHNGRLYVLGGYDGSNYLKDVWSSADGEEWALITLSADWTGRERHQAFVFPPELVLWGVGERLTANAGIAANLHTFTSQYGRGGYSYSLTPEMPGFAVSSDGVLSTENDVTAGEYTLTVWVEDDANNQTQTAVKVFVARLHLVEVPHLLGLAGIAKILHTITAEGSIPGEQYMIVAGNTQGYFALDAGSGVLSLLSTAWEGVYTLSVEVSDGLSSSRKATAAATVEIKGRQIFVLGGNDGSKRLKDVWFSADGKSWSLETDNAEWGERQGHQALSHHGRLYVLGGVDGNNYLKDVWSSADGKSWSLETDNAEWDERSWYQVLSHNGRLYVLGGDDGSNRYNDVWSSADGKNWSRETDDAEWMRRSGHQALSHNGRLYVLGGVDNDNNYLNDVWFSADGKNWSLETSNAEWDERYSHQALSHNGRLYVLGGNDGNRLNDVWWSADGKNWSLETDDAEWAGRDSHQALSHHGRLYVLGGRDNDENFLNDVWSSADGKEWELITLSTDWTAREAHQAVVFPPELVLWGVAERLTITAGIVADLHTFTAQYGRGNYTYSLSSTVSGFAVSPGGILSADSNTTGGEYTLTVWVEDDANNQTQTALRILVHDFYLVEVPHLVGLAGIAKILHTITAEGSIPGEQYMIVAGNTQGYFALDADSGVLSLLSTAWEGVYTLSVVSRKKTVAATVEIKGSQIFVLGGGNPPVYPQGGGTTVYHKDVWSSADGQNWVLETSDTGWAAYYGHKASSHNGRIYVLGGFDSTPGNYDDWTCISHPLICEGWRGGPLGHTNDVWSSADGQNWALETDDAKWSERSFHQVVSHNGLLYVLGGTSGENKGDVWSSADGKDWTQETDKAGWDQRVYYQALSHNGRIYVLGGLKNGPENDVWSSADGKDWVLETDDAEWSERSHHQAVSYNGRIYVLGGYIYEGGEGHFKEERQKLFRDVWSSADGKNWVLETDDAGLGGRWIFQAVSHNGLLHVLGGRVRSGILRDVWSSADGKKWKRITNEAAWDWRNEHQAVVFPSPLALFGVGERLTARIAGNLHTLTAQHGRGDYSYSLIPEVNGFAVSPGGVLSADGTAVKGEHTLTVWVEDDAGDRAQTALRVFVPYFNLAEVPRLFGFAGIAKVLHTIIANHGIAGEQYMMVAGNLPGHFALDADSGVLSLLSTAWDGVYTLSVEVSDSSFLSNKATVAATVEIKGRQIFVLGGRDGSRLHDVWLSMDGANWVRETADAGWAGRDWHQALSHNGRLYVLGGYDYPNHLNDVWSSTDGKNWVRETADAGWSGRYSHQALSHNGRLYVLGGYMDSPPYYLNDVWSSADGANWSLETAEAGWSGRYSHQALSHNGRLYVLGGRTENYIIRQNDVWSSADGKNWSLETAEAEWEERHSHQALSHNGRLYVLGGNIRFTPYRQNDVWSSADGKNWERKTDDAGWTQRYWHQALSHNERLYVLGGVGGGSGRDGSVRQNDVWSSADGKNWERETNGASWSPRNNHQAVIFPQPLALSGVGERLNVTAGIAENLHTFTAQYGRGDYTYSLSSTVSGFAVSPGGVLSADSNTTVGEYTLTVWVKDAAGDRAQTAIRVDVVAQSTAQSHIFTGEFWATGDESVNIVIARSSTGINLAECWRGGSGDGERFTRIYSAIWFG